MATTSRASCKRVEDVEIFQVLEESTDSDVTIFSSEEEEEDGNEPDSDEDGLLDDNSETNEDGGPRTSGPKTPHLKWTNTLNCKELQKYENLSGPKHSLPVGSSEKDFYELFVTNVFTTKLRKKLNMQLYHKEKREQWITTGKTLMWKKSSLYWNSDLYGPC